MKNNRIKDYKEKKAEEVKNIVIDKYSKNLNSIHLLLDRTELKPKTKKKIYKDFEGVYLYRQTIVNTISNMESYSSKCKTKFQNFIKKQNIELLKLRNNK